MQNEGRRNFLNSFVNQANEAMKEFHKSDKQSTPPSVVRPPYSSDEALFEECRVCDGACADICEEKIIIILEDKTPSLDFSQSGCTFCDECALVCASLENEIIDADISALSIENRVNKIALTIAISKESCLAWDKTMCFSCKEPCLENAIVFKGLFKPVIDENKCTSCGFCIARCPTNAITISELV